MFLFVKKNLLEKEVTITNISENNYLLSQLWFNYGAYIYMYILLHIKYYWKYIKMLI